MINKFSSQDRDFDSQLNALVAWETSSNEEINRSVEKIIDAVKQNGDASVLDYTNQYDSLKAHSISELIIPQERLRESFESLDNEQKMRSQLQPKELSHITLSKFKSHGLIRKKMVPF